MPLGNVDYYMNDGRNQPGCCVNKMFKPIEKLRKCDLPKGKVLPGCSHKRAFKYFIEAISSCSCHYIGFKAQSYKDFHQVNTKIRKNSLFY